MRALGRVCALVGIVSAICVGLGLLIGHFNHSDPATSVPVSLYIGGALLMLASMGATMSGRSFYRVAWDQATLHDEMARRYQPGRGIYVATGALLIALGVCFDLLL